MTGAPKPLQYQILVGCTFVDTLPQHIRRGDTFRLVRQDGSAYFVASRVLSDIDDCGVYVAERDGSENGVPFEVVQAITLLVAPVLDLGN